MNVYDERDRMRASGLPYDKALKLCELAHGRILDLDGEMPSMVFTQAGRYLGHLTIIIAERRDQAHGTDTVFSGMVGVQSDAVVPMDDILSSAEDALLGEYPDDPYSLGREKMAANIGIRRAQ